MKLHKLFRNLIHYFLCIFIRPAWWLEKLIHRNKKIWVFGAWFGKRYSDNSKWLFEYVLSHNPDIKAVWITKDEEVFRKLTSRNLPVKKASSLSGKITCLRAGYAFLTSGTDDVCKYLLNGCRQIWLWHGMPLKKIGYCEGSWEKWSPFKRFIFTLLNPYDRLLPYATPTSSDFFTPFLKESFRLPEERIWKTGLPRCDAFYSEKQEPFIEDVRRQFSGCTIMLYMPTFRMASNMDGIPFNAFTTSFGFDDKEFSDFLEHENIVFLFKPHFVDSGINLSLSSRRFKCISDSDFEDLYILLNSIDSLITDYSSVFFDFIPSGKPIYLLPFDYEEYKKNSRAHFFNMYEEMSGVLSYSWREFYDNVRNKAYKSVDYEKNHKLAEYLDGECCRKTVEEVIDIIH